MKFIYPAVFRKTDKGTYKGFFPDLEDCFGEGDTLDEAIEEANMKGGAYDSRTRANRHRVPHCFTVC